jgi:hypothetical protein
MPARVHAVNVKQLCRRMMKSLRFISLSCAPYHEKGPAALAGQRSEFQLEAYERRRVGESVDKDDQIA